MAGSESNVRDALRWIVSVLMYRRTRRRFCSLVEFLYSPIVICDGFRYQLNGGSVIHNDERMVLAGICRDNFPNEKQLSRGTE